MSTVKFTRPLNTYVKRKSGKKGWKVSRGKKNKQISKNTQRINRITKAIEKKHHDKVISNVFGNDIAPNAIHLMSQGDTSGGRTGLKIYAKNLYINLSLQWKSTATQETTARFIVFLDKNSNGAIPGGTDLMESLATVSLYDNVNEGRRFVVLCDKIFNNRNVTTDLDKFEGYNMIIPVNRTVWYLDSGSTATALGRNSLYYICIGDVASADADAVAVTGNARLYYDDL